MINTEQLIMFCCLSAAMGFSWGYWWAGVTTKVTKPDPAEEVASHDWLVRCEPIIQKLEEASLMPKGGTISPSGCKNMAILIDDMATRLDHTRHLVLTGKLKQDS